MGASVLQSVIWGKRKVKQNIIEKIGKGAGGGSPAGCWMGGL